MSGGIYFDTSILVKSYVFEETSASAIELIESSINPVVCSHLHAIEIPNAIRLKRFRGEISPAEESTAIRAFRDDVECGRLQRPGYDLGEVFMRAERLSAKHSGEMGTRSLDILHIAVALLIRCSGFASFDTRQRKLAEAEGLQTIPSREDR